MNTELIDRAYSLYLATRISLKHDFHALDKTKVDWRHGWGEPDKQTTSFAYYFLWKDIRILTYQEFCCSQFLTNHWISLL